MRQNNQAILLVSSDIDSVAVRQCKAVDLPSVTFSVAKGFDSALKQIQEGGFSLVIAFITEGLQQAEAAQLCSAQSPNPVIVFIPENDGELVISALRYGANDVFIQQGGGNQAEALFQSIRRLLRQAELIEKNHQYREELENSLSELQADHQAALHIQQNMLPDTVVRIGDVSARYLLIPSLYLSGDFVDVLEIDKSKMLFYLADVSGHGASSALVTVLFKNMTNRLLRNFRRGSSFDILSPIAVLNRINAELLETGLGKHASIFIGLYNAENQELLYAVGGHHPMPILREGDGIRFLEGRGMPVGLFPEPFFEEKTVKLPDWFEIVLFSDGILEVLSEPNMDAKEQRLLDVVAATDGVGPEAIRDKLISGSAGAMPDDIAIMTICRQ